MVTPQSHSTLKTVVHLHATLFALAQLAGLPFDAIRCALTPDINHFVQYNIEDEDESTLISLSVQQNMSRLKSFELKVRHNTYSVIKTGKHKSLSDRKIRTCALPVVRCRESDCVRVLGGGEKPVDLIFPPTITSIFFF